MWYGIVVKAGNKESLREAIQIVVDNPDVINQWKNRTTEYVESISYIKVAEYLSDVLNYAFSEKVNIIRPQCPWLRKDVNS